MTIYARTSEYIYIYIHIYIHMSICSLVRRLPLENAGAEIKEKVISIGIKTNAYSKNLEKSSYFFPDFSHYD